MKSPKNEQLTDLIATALAEGDKAHAAAERCGWVPGSGCCRQEARGGCPLDCPFRAQRLAERQAVLRWRRRRRTPHRPTPRG